MRRPAPDEHQTESKHLKLTSSSGAYWRGSETNKAMLARGSMEAAFATKDETERISGVPGGESRRRDHNKLGREMELFTTVDVIGQGLPLLMPKGAKIIQTTPEMDRGRGGQRLGLYPHQDTADGQKRSVQDLRPLGSLQRRHVRTGR